MLTIGVVTDNAVSATEWQGISQRLRGATIAATFDSGTGHSLCEVCDAVVFVGSRPLEKTLVERALGGGKHVLLATEPCLSVADLEALSGVAQKGGLQFAVVNSDRYLPSRQLIKQQIGGSLGNIGLVRVHRWEAVRAECRPTALGLPGPLVRDLELVLWLAGESPRVVYALEQATNKSEAVTGVYFQVHLGFSAGMALIDYTNQLPSGGGYHCVSVIGSSGAACADDQQNAQLLYRGGHPQALQTGEGTRHLAAMIQEFVDAIAQRQDLSPTVTAWHSVLTLVEAVRQSLVTHQAIHRKES